MSDFDDRKLDIIERLEKFKDDLVTDFENLGLGKDLLLRVHGALDQASAEVAATQPVEGHDLNVDLAENPEDHPAAGQDQAPINTDPNVNQASYPDADHAVRADEADPAAPVAADQAATGAPGPVVDGEPTDAAPATETA